MTGDDDKFTRPIGAILRLEDGTKINGQIKIEPNGSLDRVIFSLVSEDYVKVERGQSLHGICDAGKVSLLECVTGGPSRQTMWSDFTVHHGDTEFRYALFGDEHLTSDQSTIRSAQFVLEGIEKAVFSYDQHKVFGLILDPSDAIMNALEKDRFADVEGEFIKGEALVSYFTGEHEVLPGTETVIGIVSVSRAVQFDAFRITDESVYVTVDFDDTPTTIEGALDKVNDLRQFFSWIMGYAPAVQRVKLFTSRINEFGHRESKNGQTDTGIRAFGLNGWEEESASHGFYGTLIDASKHKDHFIEVMCNWLDRNQNDERCSANTRYFGCLREAPSPKSIEDIMVSSANMFDLMPSCDKPKRKPLSSDLSAIVKVARCRAKETRATQERDRVLDGLRRIETGSPLRDIVMCRASIVKKHFGTRMLPGLDEVIRQAVACRNHYTHGPSGSKQGFVDFTDMVVVGFLAETLLFIYAVSELILCGWNKTTALLYSRHPIGRYLSHYRYFYQSVLKLQ